MTRKKTTDGVLLLLATTFGSVTVSCMSMTRESVTALRTGCHATDVVVGPEETHDGLTEYDAWCGDEKWHCEGPSWASRVATMQCTPARSTRTPIVAESNESPKSAKASPWVTYESSVCGVSAVFPDEPIQAEQEVATLAGKKSVEQVIYGKPDGTGIMALGCATIGRANVSLARLLDGARTGMLANVKGTLLSERPVVGGREVHFSIEQGEAVARLYLVGEKVLFAMVLPVDAFPDRNTRRFLDSVSSL